MVPPSLLARIPIRSLAQIPLSGRLGVVATSAASSRWASIQAQQNFASTRRDFMLKPLYTVPPRDYSSSSSNNGSGSESKNWMHTIGSTIAGLGGAALAFLFVNKDSFQVSCAAKEGCCDNKESDCIERKCGDSDCLRKMDREEEMIQKANSDLEKALKDVKPKAVELTESALKAYCEATELIRLFMDKVYCAIEEDNLDSPRFEEVWCDVYDTALKRCEKVKDALIKGQCAWEMLCRLREVIENGKACKYTACNPLLITAEEALLCAERELLNAKAKMECLQSESRLVEQYRNVIEDFRRDLKAEVDSMIPSEECKMTLTGNECTMVITHAYKKVLRVQKELAQVQECGTNIKSTPEPSNNNNDGCNKC